MTTPPAEVHPEEHVKLARFALRGLSKREDEEEDVGFAIVVLVTAAQAWNAGRVTCGWSTYAANRVRWEWIRRNYNRGKPRRVSEVPLFLPGKTEDDEIERRETAVEDPAIRQAEARRDVRQLLAGLEERERYVLERRFGIRGEAATRDEIGQEIGVTREAVRQAERKALGKLRKRAVRFRLTHRTNGIR